MPKVLSIYDREREMKAEGFYIFDVRDKIMMCKFCNVRIDWSRKDTCTKHIKNETHTKKKKVFLQQNASTSKQVSINHSMKTAATVRVQKQEFVSSFVEMMTEANIPLEKVDHPSMRKWLNTYVEGAGDLPTANRLREAYLPKLHVSKKENLKNALRNKNVLFLCDETTDRVGRCMFVILIRVLSCSRDPNVFVGAVKELPSATGAECSRAILSTVAEYDIQYENVVGIVSDSAKYMTTCANTLKTIFSEEMVHIQCWAHKLNIVASLWSSTLVELNQCIQNTKHAFLNARKRKHRFVTFLKQKYPEEEKKPLLFPVPVMTRWNSWFGAAKYVAEYLEDLVEFLVQEEEGSSAVTYFRNMSSDNITVIKCSSVFLVEHCSKTIEAIVQFEGANYVFSHKVYPELSDILNQFLLISRGSLDKQTSSELSKLSTKVKQHSVRQDFISMGLKCHTKLTDLMNCDAGKDFVFNIGKLFHPKYVVNNTVDESLYASAKKVPLLSKLSQQKFLEGYLAFQSQVLELLSETKPVDVKVLLGLHEQHPTFAEQSVSALWIPPSNADSERAFSAYSHILSDLRTNLTPQNLAVLFEQYFGSKLAADTVTEK